MAVPVFRAASTLSGGNGTSAVVSKPTGTVDDDIILVYLYVETDNAITIPSGWTQFELAENNTASKNFRTYGYWKRASSEGTNWTWSWTGSVWRETCAISISGATLGVDVIHKNSSAATTSNGTTTPAVSFTTTTNECLIVWVGGSWDGGAWTDPDGASSTWTERSDIGGSLGVATRSLSTAGATGSVTGTAGATSSLTAIMVAIPPVVVGIVADSGSYVITGNDAILTYNANTDYQMVVNSGSYAITGNDATLTYTGVTYYLSTTGSDSNDGSYASPWASPSHAYGLMNYGDILILKNGTYSGLVLMNTSGLVPPNGTTIKAETFGSVIVDMGGSGAVFDLAGTPTAGHGQDMTIDGIVVINQNNGSQINSCDGLTILRCGFGDAANDNSANIAINNCDDVLMEECFAWGNGRYKITFYECNQIILRLCLVRIDLVDAHNEPMAGISIYRCVDAEIQNCIVVDGDSSAFWDAAEYSGAFYTPSTAGFTGNVHFHSCIALNVEMAFGLVSRSTSDITFTNCVGWDLRELVYTRDSVSYDKCTFGQISGPALQTSTVGMQWISGDDPVNATAITNSILYNIAGTALTNWADENYNDFYGNTTNRNNTNTGANSITINPQLQYCVSTTGANSSLTGAGDHGGNIGATITKLVGIPGTRWGESGYTDVTSTEMWPFPNETIIGSLMKNWSNGGLTGNRGFAVAGETLTHYIWNYLGNGNPYGATTAGYFGFLDI